MQSNDYVPNVSGWKIDPASGSFEMASDRGAVVGVDPKAIYSGKSKPKNATNTHVSIKNGVLTVTHDGVVRLKLCNLYQTAPEPEQPQPFKVDGGQVSINKAFIQYGTITNAKTGDELSFRAELSPTGQPYAAGLGIGVGSQPEQPAIKCMCGGGPAGFGKSTIDAKLGRHLAERAAQIKPAAETVRDVIRTELRPGGLLHRSK